MNIGHFKLLRIIFTILHFYLQPFHGCASLNRIYLLTNEEIIAGCIRKDRQAQRALYEKYATKMLGFCRRYSNNPQEAQDLLQEGFIKVFDSIDSLKNSAQLEGWLTRLFINLALSAYRKNQRGPVWLDIEKAEANISDDDTEYDISAEPMTYEEVMQCLQEVPEKYRLVLNAYAVEGLSHREIAEALQTTESNTKSMLSRARKMLRDIVEQKKNNAGKQ